MGEAPIPPGGPEHLERFLNQHVDTSSVDPPLTEAQMEMVASWTPRDVARLLELCSASLKFQEVFDIHKSLLSRGALSRHPDSVLDVAFGQRNRAELIFEILQFKVYHFSDIITDDSRLVLQHALIDIFEPSFASMAVSFINRENICDHDLAWRIALVADDRAEFLVNHFPILLPEKVQGEFTHYTKKDKHEVRTHYWKITPDMYNESWKGQDANEVFAGLFSHLPSLKESHRLFYHATTHVGAEGILEAGIKCSRKRHDFSPYGATYFHTNFSSAFQYYPRPMSIMIYAIPMAELDQLQGDWKVFPQADDEWESFVYLCRYGKGGDMPDHFPLCVEGPIAANLPKDRYSVKRSDFKPGHVSGETQFAVCKNETHHQLSTRTSVTRLFDRHLHAVISFSSIIME